MKDRSFQPEQAWNKIPREKAAVIIKLALAELALSLRELAVKFGDTTAFDVPESTV